MRWTPTVAGAATLLLGLMLCAEAYESLASTPEPEQTITPPSIDSIRELAELTVLEVEASEVVTTEVNGYTGGTSAIVQVHGTITLGVDLDRARFVEVDEVQQHIVLALPPTEVRRVAIDHQTSRVLRCQRSGLWRMAIGDALEDQAIKSALVIGQQRLGATASRDDVDQRARGHAASVLGRFVSELGWTLDIRWDE